eukprot:jgi/Botrbrau1/5562/Bobra.0023s0045.1
MGAIAEDAPHAIFDDINRYSFSSPGTFSQTTSKPACGANVWRGIERDPTSVIVVPNNFRATQGVELQPGVFVGKHLSHGLQGGVYDLVDSDGKQLDMVLKIVHRHAPLAEVEREWEVGRRLDHLADPDGNLPGFMGVGAGIRTKKGKFVGMTLERVHGRNVNKVICNERFNDVTYVFDMLYGVFTALDRAQSALGFHHSDLRLANVMEVLPEEEGGKGVEQESARPSSERLLRVHSLEVERHRGKPSALKKYQFKIIDYGLANFEETYAAGPDIIYEDNKFEDGERGSLSPQSSELGSSTNDNGTGGSGIRLSSAIPFLKLNRNGVEQLPRLSAMEHLYRYMWRRKGDVYHLVFNLCEWLDGRVWPQEDELDVLRLVDLIHHVTGVRIKAWFVKDTDTKGGGIGGWIRKPAEVIYQHGESLHFLRRWEVRFRSWLRPSNPGLTAAEALTAPFFTKRRSCRAVIRGGSTTYAHLDGTQEDAPKVPRSGAWR